MFAWPYVRRAVSPAKSVSGGEASALCPFRSRWMTSCTIGVACFQERAPGAKAWPNVREAVRPEKRSFSGCESSASVSFQFKVGDGM